MVFKHAWMAWSVCLGSSCQNLFCNQCRDFLAQVSLGCHCTDLRNYMCELNKLVHHCAIDRPVTWLCDTGCFPHVVVTLWPVSMVKSITLSCAATLAAGVLPGSLGFALNT